MIYLLSLSQLPIVLIFAYVYARDTHEREPLRLLLYCFLGGIVSFFPAVGLELVFKLLIPTSKSLPLFSHGIEMLLGVALIEEGCKLWFLLKIAYRSNEFNEPFDGIVYAVAISLGMAALENALYSLEHGVATAWLRMFSAVPLHAMCAVLMGFYVGQAKFLADKRRARAFIFLGLCAATLAHGTYDYFVAIGTWVYVPLSLFILVVQLILALRAMRIHNSHPPVVADENCVFLPDQERSLNMGPVDMSVISLRLIAALSSLWAGVNLVPSVREGLGIDPDAGVATGILSLFILIVALRTTRGLKERRPPSWRTALGLFVVFLPTPAFILSLIGLFGLLHPSTRLSLKNTNESSVLKASSPPS